MHKIFLTIISVVMLVSCGSGGNGNVGKTTQGDTAEADTVEAFKSLPATNDKVADLRYAEQKTGECPEVTTAGMVNWAYSFVEKNEKGVKKMTAKIRASISDKSLLALVDAEDACWEKLYKAESGYKSGIGSLRCATGCYGTIYEVQDASCAMYLPWIRLKCLEEDFAVFAEGKEEAPSRVKLEDQVEALKKKPYRVISSYKMDEESMSASKEEYKKSQADAKKGAAKLTKSLDAWLAARDAVEEALAPSLKDAYHRHTLRAVCSMIRDLDEYKYDENGF